jgi:hypothetical protein
MNLTSAASRKLSCGSQRMSATKWLVRADSVSGTPRTGPFFCVAANSPFVPRTAVSKCSNV